jgi:hypothetical protein
MATTLSDLQGWRDALFQARMSGVQSVHYGDHRVDYKSDSEMRSAIAAADAEIAKLQGTRVKEVRLSTSKGL